MRNKSQHPTQLATLLCSVKFYVAVCCSVLLCVAVCCRVLQGVAGCCCVLQCAILCCSVSSSRAQLDTFTELPTPTFAVYPVHELAAFLDGYCSTVQGMLDWFEVDLGFIEHLFRLICVFCVFLFSTPASHSPLVLFGTFCTASPARWECLYSQPSILSVAVIPSPPTCYCDICTAFHANLPYALTTYPTFQNILAGFSPICRMKSQPLPVEFE